MTVTRVLRTAAATLSHTFYVGETPTDPTGTPTAAIVAADGVSVQSGNATVVGSSSGRVTFAMSAVATLERLTVTWTAIVSGVTVVEVDYVEIVGGFFFGLAEGRASDSSLSNTTTYTTAMLEAARLEVEQECEMICDRAFVPRYERAVLDGTGTWDLLLRHPEPDRTAGDVRTIRSISMAPALDGTFTAFTAGELAAVAVTEGGYLRRTDGNVWTEGVENIRVEWEYGLNAPPADVVGAAKLRLRHILNRHKSGIPENATSYSEPDGSAYRLDLPGPYKTGYPTVDGPYSRYSRRDGAGTGDGGKAVPASRTLTFQPQTYSLYHR